MQFIVYTVGGGGGRMWVGGLAVDKFNSGRLTFILTVFYSYLLLCHLLHCHLHKYIILCIWQNPNNQKKQNYKQNHIIAKKQNK
jgi:hypothetical protein